MLDLKGFYSKMLNGKCDEKHNLLSNITIPRQAIVLNMGTLIIDWTEILRPVSDYSGGNIIPKRPQSRKWYERPLGILRENLLHWKTMC